MEEALKSIALSSKTARQLPQVPIVTVLVY